jgi:hypothetical protein
MTETPPPPVLQPPGIAGSPTIDPLRETAAASDTIPGAERTIPNDSRVESTVTGQPPQTATTK